jgi:peptidoglycan LD-endopeptidase CwlK
MAGDFVLFENGTWTWDTRGVRKRYWAQLQTAGKQLGLEPLRFELPHLQLAGIRIQELAAKTAA